MKTNLLFIPLLFLLTVSGQAQSVIPNSGEIDWINNRNHVFTNNLVATNITATTVQTNTFLGARSRYHTFEFAWTGTGTNAATNYLDFSVSGNNWTNVFFVGGTASYSQIFQYTGEAPYWRERTTMYSTNGSMNTYYAGY